MNISKTTHLQMVKYLVQLNASLLNSFVQNTVRTQGYRVENDSSDHEDYIDRKLSRVDTKLKRLSMNQLLNLTNPFINYENYRKLFNKTLEKIYKDQVGIVFNRLSFDDRFLLCCRRSNVVTIRKRFDVFSTVQLVTL